MRSFVVAPPEPVVTWDEAAEHLKLDSDATDRVYVESLVATATAHIDGPGHESGAGASLGRALGVQDIELRFDPVPGASSVKLPFPPVVELLEVKYLDRADVLQTADNADFELLGRVLVPARSAFPWEGGSTRREAVRVRYRTGYAALPTPIKAAILLMVGDLYANRETTIAGATVTTVPMSLTVDRLLEPFRSYS